MNNKLNAVNLLLSDARGIYIPRDFVQCFDLSEWGFFKDHEAILNNPDDEFYWEEWSTVLDNAKFTDKEGNVFRLYQDGDLFAICYELMTDQEKINFGFEEDAE